MVEIYQKLAVPPGTPLEYRVALELPDWPIGRMWMNWYTQTGSSEGCVPVILSSRSEWLARPEVLRRALQSLMTTGKPTLNWVGVWFKKQQNPRDPQVSPIKRARCTFTQ